MKQPIYYWIALSIIGFIHLYFLSLNFSWNIPFYVIYLATIIITYYLYKRTKFSYSHPGDQLGNTLSLIQVLLLLPYSMLNPSWIYITFLLTSLMIEWVRWKADATIFRLKADSEQFEAERDHITETFRTVRSERHDFLKHISSLHYMIENHHFDEAAAYLEDMVGGYEETNLSIKGERGSVAGILHQMYRVGKGSGVAMVYDLDVPLSNLPLSDKKLVTLIGNLLSNSIDASTEWQKHHGLQPTITLQFYKRSGLYVLLCKNASLPIPNPVLDQLFQKAGHTTKKGHEGLGTKIIQDIVNEHQGFLDFVYRDEEFTVKIKIPAIHS